MTRTRLTLRSIVTVWAPPFALMAVIFALSAQPDLSTGLGTWDLIGRKLIHMAEYGLLVFLWWRALRGVAPGPRALALAIVGSLAYAGTDELHQTFIHGRHGTPVDILIDAVGMTVVAVAIARRGR